VGSPPRFDIETPKPRVEPTPRHVRVRVDDTLLADSRRALLLVWYGPGRLPTYVLAGDDVRTDLLRPGGDDGVFDAELPDGTVVPRAAQQLKALGGPLRAAAGGWTFPRDGRVRWFEEATEVFVYARDRATASTRSCLIGTCAPNSTTTCSRNRRGRSRCLRPACRSAGTSLARTCGWRPSSRPA